MERYLRNRNSFLVIVDLKSGVVCVCMCAYERERERQRDRKIKKRSSDKSEFLGLTF